MKYSALFPIVALVTCMAAPAQAKPEWIWLSKDVKPSETVYFRTSFKLDQVPALAQLRVACDNGAEVIINGKSAAKNPNWDEPTLVRVDALLKTGENWVAVKATNDDSNAAGFILYLEGGSDKKSLKSLLESNAKTWKASNDGSAWDKADANVANWQAPHSFGAIGIDPWGDVFRGGKGKGGQLTPAEELNLLDGFKVELVYEVPRGTQGSWVSLTYDNKNRLIAGDQDGGIYRLTLGGAEPQVEKIDVKVGKAHGLLYANDALYVVANGGQSGLYRLRDTNNDDKFDEETFLRPMDGGGEHGPHQVILAPDGKSLYVIGGNHTKIPNPEFSLVPRRWQEDHLLPRMWDANGHAQGILAPGGWFAQTDFDGKTWRLVSIGYRNQYDLAIDPNGDMFTFDSDMEWDIGAPWYRPTRVCHVVPGSEFGWRSGSGVWPSYYLDSLPPTIDIGPGSPTGTVFGTGAKFPAKYQNALYILDWTYGTLYAIHLKPNGASFTAEKESFITGKPFPLTDAIILPSDHAMYVSVGGRGTQSGIYRITYAGSESTALVPPTPLTPEAKVRREMEELYTSKPDPAVVEKAWPYLKHGDRFIRFAARTAIEHQPVDSWREKALRESSDLLTKLHALTALARCGEPADGPKILKTLASAEGESMRQGEVLDLLRVYALTLTRLYPNKPDEATMAELRALFDPMFPAPSSGHGVDALNRDLCEILVYLNSKQVVAKAVPLLATAKDDPHTDRPDQSLLDLNDGYASSIKRMQETRPNRNQMALAFVLRNATEGWSPELRRAYFRWFNNAKKFQGGNSFAGFVRNIRNEALEKVPAAERPALEALAEEMNAAPADLPRPVGPGKFYEMAELLKVTEGGLHGRNYENGKKMFQAGLCAMCHRFSNEGSGTIGPDITGVGSRYTMKDLIENIIDPSKVISDQYESMLIEKKDGNSIVGRILKNADGKLSIAENPLAPETLTEIAESDVKQKSRYPVSAMPPGLLNSLNEAEVLDLLAYLMSAGNPEDKVFK